MAKQIVVVESLSDWRPFVDSAVTVVHADDYLTGQSYFSQRNVQVINLCRSYRYLSVGYYVSLLAEARGHRVLPSVQTMLSLSQRTLISLELSQLEMALPILFDGDVVEGEERRLTILFGQVAEARLLPLARLLFEQYGVPILEAQFRYNGGWRLSRLRAKGLRQLPVLETERFVDALNGYRHRPNRRRGKAVPRYDVAILYDPEERQPPSDMRALRQFIRAGQALGLAVELITRRDYARLAEYDALFIRTTTNIDHYTYRFARKAQSEGMVVIDDPRSIQLCTNKVYLAELLQANNVRAPQTVIMGRGDIRAAAEAIGFPMVLKLPDGAFSQGVFKVESELELREVATRLFRTSELLLAQEYLYTSYDWRIGILNRQPLYASQYFMSKRHWQIVHYDSDGGYREGGFRTVDIASVPEAVVNTALTAANLIGDGLYGVDLKQVGELVYVIEVNDNPNLDYGVEDKQLKYALYMQVMSEFLRRLEMRHNR